MFFYLAGISAIALPAGKHRLAASGDMIQAQHAVACRVPPWCGLTAVWHRAVVTGRSLRDDIPCTRPDRTDHGRPPMLRLQASQTALPH